MYNIDCKISAPGDNPQSLNLDQLTQTGMQQAVQAGVRLGLTTRLTAIVSARRGSLASDPVVFLGIPSAPPLTPARAPPGAGAAMPADGGAHPAVQARIPISPSIVWRQSVVLIYTSFSMFRARSRLFAPVSIDGSLTSSAYKSEPPEARAQRGLAAIRRFLDSTTGDVCVVSHGHLISIMVHSIAGLSLADATNSEVRLKSIFTPTAPLRHRFLVPYKPCVHTRRSDGQRGRRHGVSAQGQQRQVGAHANCD